MTDDNINKFELQISDFMKQSLIFNDNVFSRLTYVLRYDKSLLTSHVISQVTISQVTLCFSRELVL